MLQHRQVHYGGYKMAVYNIYFSPTGGTKKVSDTVALSLSENKIDIDSVKAEISSYKEINHHMKSIELLDEELYLNEDNCLRIKNMYNVDNLNWKIDNNKSPVFNYLLSKILDVITEAESLDIAS